MAKKYIAHELIFPYQDEAVYLAEDYEQLQQTNQELLEALEDMVWVFENLLNNIDAGDEYEMYLKAKAITNAKQVMGDK